MPTDHQARDLSLLTAIFPETVLDDENHPQIQMTLQDAEGDPVSVSFDADGTATITTDDYSYLALRADQLVELGEAAVKVMRLMEAWYETASGKAWEEAHAA